MSRFKGTTKPLQLAVAWVSSLTLLCALLVVGNSSTRSAHAWSFGASPTQAIGLDGFVGSEIGAGSLEAIEDEFGNIFVLGRTAGTIDVDPSSAVKSFGDGSDSIYYVAKYSTTGVLQWAYDWKSGSGSPEIKTFAVGPGGYVILGGFTPTFDLDPTSGVDSVASDYQDAFLMRINADGTYGWSRVFPAAGANSSVVREVEILPTGEIVAGIEFDAAITVHSTTIPVVGNVDLIIARFTADGLSLQWMAKLQGSASDWVSELDVSADGSFLSIVGGFVGSTTTLTASDSSTTSINRISGAVQTGIAFALNSSGLKNYATTFGALDKISRSSALHSSQDVFIATNDGNIVKISNTGIETLVGSFVSTVYITAMTSLSNGDLVFVGEFPGTVDLDPGAGVDNQSAIGISAAGFMLHLTSSLSVLRKQILDETEYEALTSVSKTRSGGVIVGGRSLSTSLNLSNTTYDGRYTRGAGTDSMAFIIKYDSAWTSGVPTTTTTTTAAPAPTVPPVSAPTSVTYRAGNKKVTLSWSSVVGASSYIVKNSKGAIVCTGSITSCSISRLINGKSYSLTVQSVSSAGKESSDARVVKVIAGFNLKKTSFSTRARPNLATIATTPSKGQQRWTVQSGKCVVSKGRVLMPAKKGTCRLRISVAKKGSYPAMAMTVTVTAK